MRGVLELNEKSLVIVSNKLIDARYRLNISEIRLFVLMIFAFDKVRGEVQLSVKDVGKLIGLEGNFYSALKRSTQNLMRQIITIEQENGDWEAYNITSRASCIGGVFTIKPNPQIEQHLIELKRCFTKYELAYGMALKSTYGFRLYQLGKKSLGLRKPVVQIGLEEFRQQLGIKKGEYKQIWNFRKKVLDVAQSDVNAITDIHVSCRSIKQGVGGRVAKFEFTFSEKTKKPEILLDSSSIAYVGEEETEAENTENPFLEKEENCEPEEKPLVVPEKSEAVKLLLDCGISEGVAMQLANEHEMGYIREKIAIANAHPEYVKNKAGFIIKAVRENWIDEDIARMKREEARLNVEKEGLERRNRLKGIWDRYRVHKGALGLKEYERMTADEVGKLKGEFLGTLNAMLRGIYAKKENFGYEDGMFRGFFLNTLELPSFDRFLAVEGITLSNDEREILEKELVR